MIVAFSTSSPIASVALLDATGIVLAADEHEAAHRASGACMDMLNALLRQTGTSLRDATVFAADLGPGSFTGVRVGVTLAKTFAFVYGALTMGATSFDLIDPVGTVVLPSKRGEFFVRRYGQPPIRTVTLPEEPTTGFGHPGSTQTYPSAALFGALVLVLPRVEPVRLMPEYLIEPSISLPKKPFRSAHG